MVPSIFHQFDYFTRVLAGLRVGGRASGLCDGWWRGYGDVVSPSLDGYTCLFLAGVPGQIVADIHAVPTLDENAVSTR